MPVVAPVIDYSNVINHSVLGGEVSYKTNFTNLTRDTAAFDPINAAALANGSCLPTASADPATSIDAGELPASRHARHLHAIRRLKRIGAARSPIPAGEIWTPFASIRADAIDASISRTSRAFRTSCPLGDTQALRVMPTVGLEYRYPFINVQPWGTTTVEPIAQVIIRPNEPYAGKLPNEDAQSMTFDTSNLFSVDKFSGYDRVEGGGRANVGVQATTQFDRGGSVNAVFGQSYQLFGLEFLCGRRCHQYRRWIPACRQAGIRLCRAASAIRPTGPIRSATRARFERSNREVNRFEAEGRANFDRWSVSMLYGDYAAAAGYRIS